MSPGTQSAQHDHDLVREIVDLLPAYVAYVDADLRYVTANRMYQERFGRAQQEIVGQLVADVTGSAFESVAGHLRAALAGVTQQFETAMISVEGNRILSVSHLPHRNARGEVVGVIVYGYDITERRRTELALLQSEKLAAVGRLASSIAHEINNPLESVVNLLYLIEGSAREDVEQTRTYAHMAQAELARVTEITTNTLRSFRQPTGRRRADLGELTRSVLALYAGRLTNSNVVVTHCFRGNVSLVCFDGEVRQVLNNLVGNALDAMRQGGRLAIRAHRVNGGVRWTVADSGHGMGSEARERMFEPFYTTKGISGTGLGLWIVKELIVKHHGRLQVKSAEGKGTVISLYLPDEEVNAALQARSQKLEAKG